MLEILPIDGFFLGFARRAPLQDGLQDNQSTWVEEIIDHLVEATPKGVGPTTWVYYPWIPQRE
jgi:hypothetical protein